MVAVLNSELLDLKSAMATRDRQPGREYIGQNLGATPQTPAAKGKTMQGQLPKSGWRWFYWQKNEIWEKLG